MKVYLATTNEGKIKEITAALVGGGIELMPIKLDDIIEPQSNDMVEVSKSKARQAFELLKKSNVENPAVLVDDAGIYFEKYNEFPGVMTKYLMDGVGIEGVKKLFTEGDRAHFQTVLSYMDETLSEPVSFIGTSEGHLSLTDNNLDLESGLPYNHLFIYDTCADFVYKMSVEERSEFNHRMRAARKFMEYVKGG
jgi:non-canonical purine NTP pyrophosphatase (RdgB/HAM1 family)